MFPAVRWCYVARPASQSLLPRESPGQTWLDVWRGRYSVSVSQSAQCILVLPPACHSHQPPVAPDPPSPTYVSQRVNKDGGTWQG